MLKTIIFLTVWLPVTLWGQTDSLDKANQEYFQHKTGDFYLRGHASWLSSNNINGFDVSLGYKKMITDRRFYGVSVGFLTIESYSIVTFGPTYGIYFKKNSTILDLPNHPFIMGHLYIDIPSYRSTDIGIVSYLGSTFPLKGRFGLTPRIILGYSSDFMVGFYVGIVIDPN
jgi:hypothetical protein